MRYAIFTDVHANLEALEAVLKKIDELAEQAPIDQIWFLGDLVGYGPNPNECIELLRTRTEVILAGNHDWAAIGKLDLDDFSPVARISAEWTTKQLTEEHVAFLSNLPERIVLGACTLVHGSPYGPLWEYLTSEALAERSFQYFDTRYCFVGHTHVPVIFQQPDLSNVPTVPLTADEDTDDDEETQKMVAIRPVVQATQQGALSENAPAAVQVQNAVIEQEDTESATSSNGVVHHVSSPIEQEASEQETETIEGSDETSVEAHSDDMKREADDTHETRDGHNEASQAEALVEENEDDLAQPTLDEPQETQEAEQTETTEETREDGIAEATARLDAEVEELLALLGLSQSLVKVTNEMLTPPIGEWQAPDDYRAIVNPGGVGQPRDGNPQAAFMIYDTEKGFTFYRIPYDYETTQKKIIEAGLPPYLAARLAYGR